MHTECAVATIDAGRAWRTLQVSTEAGADDRNMAPDNHSLVTRAAGGDHAAFESLYRRHLGKVFSYLVYSTPTIHDAEELTQDVFLTAWRKLSQFRRESRFTTWLMAIAVGTCRMWYRSNRRRVKPAGDADMVLRLVSPLPDVSTEELMDLRNAIAELPHRARSVLVLHELGGYRHEEVAFIMGITVGASKAQLNRAKRLLREVMNHE